MIPSDLAARLRTLTEASFFNTEPPVPGLQRARAIQSQLPELVPGQRFLAVLQRTLPDGSFRAIVAGKEMTLALNTSAKAGDTLELEVTQTTPRAVFARVLSTETAQQGAANASAQPTLSSTGKLISFLLTGQPAPKPASLADNRPLMPTPPATPGQAAQLAPVLRQALSQSGLFYESHQAQWVRGKLDTAALMREPQGQASARAAQPAQPGPAAAPGRGAPSPAGGAIGQGAQSVQGGLAGAAGQASAPAGAAGAAGAAGPSLAATFSNLASLLANAGTPGQPAGALLQAGLPTAAGQTPGGQPPGTQPQGPQPGLAGAEESAEGLRLTTTTGDARPAPGTAAGQPGSAQAGSAAERAATAGAGTQAAPAGEQASAARANTQPIPDRLLPVVHQQLDALATQQYVVQGQAWPGQPVEWIIEDPEHDGAEGEQADATWNTTLRLTLPRLGGVEAVLHLTAAGVALRLRADEDGALQALDSGAAELASALEAANLKLTGLVVERRPPAAPEGP